MRSGTLCANRLVLSLLAFFGVVGPALAQNVQNNNAGGGAGSQLPAGVLISPDGVLRVRQFADKTGALAKTRTTEARAKLGALAKPSELRKISLNRLEAAIAERLAAGKEPTDEMKYLAGLTRRAIRLLLSRNERHRHRRPG